MTTEELQKLKTEAEELRAAAKAAAEEAAADPSDTAKQASAAAAAQKATDAETKVAAAAAAVSTAAAFLSHIPSTDTSKEIEGFKFRIILLALYLLVMTLISLYLLGGLMLAETDEEDIKKIVAEKSCCAELTRTSDNSNTLANTNANSAQRDSNANANSTVSNTTATNQATNTNANTPGTANANIPAANSNANGAANANADAARALANAANANVNVAPKPTPNSQNPELSIGKDVYVDIPYVVRNTILSADSYLFLVVLFSGMLGGTIRAVHSLVRHLGLRNFSFYWTWFYISLPFVGGGLSEVIYFVIRGGFYGGSFGKGLVLNIFSFAALAALTGLFTDQAMEKLKDVAVTLLKDAPPKVENAKQIQEKKDAEKKNT